MIETIPFETLRRIGLTGAVVQQLAAADTALAEDPGALMRVTEVQREGLTLHDGECEHAARQLPALRAHLAAAADALAVGDWVLVHRNALGEWWVHARVPPLNQLARRLHDGRDKVERVVIVSNVDTALLVMGVTEDFSLRRLERYVALVRLAGVGAVVVLTKRDLAVPALVDERLAQVRALVPADVEAVAVDATGDEPRQLLAPWLDVGRTLVMLGSSGAGKSTLTNALAGHALQDTGGNRRGDGRGRHTTTSRSLHVVPGGACIIDTPGLRTLRLDGDEQRLSAVFEDIAALALQCRFRDCRHGDEPGCAVREGVAAERLRNFHKLQREAQRDTQSVLQRKAQVSLWKARSKAARVHIRAKRG